jgi:hypothetical protein
MPHDQEYPRRPADPHGRNASFTWTVPHLRRLLLLEASSAMSEQVKALQGFDKHDQSRAAVMAGRGMDADRVQF